MEIKNRLNLSRPQEKVFFYRHNYFHIFLSFRALCSGGWKKNGFFKSIFHFPKLDIYKCPFFKTLFTFGSRKVEEYRIFLF